jgi:molybdenum cofactor biosynthesis protein MoaC
VDSQGRAKMVDVGQKPRSRRLAHARAVISLPDAAVVALLDASNNRKGSPLSVAQIAGIAGAKLTSTLVPLCHPIPIDFVDVALRHEQGRVIVDCHVGSTNVTGVEMEALSGASAAALCVYDMLKAASHDITWNVCLMAKSGGKREFKRPAVGCER